jgi:Sigma-70 region 2
VSYSSDNEISKGVLAMNIKAELGNRVEGPEGPREWEYWQQLVFPSTFAHAARNRPLGAMLPIGNGSIRHRCQQITQPFAVRSESAKGSSMSELRSEDENASHRSSQGNLEALDVLLSRYRSTLSLVAYRVLGDQHLVEDAVQRCLLSASRNVPQFENEGAFRSWLVRVLIDEALLILRERE